MNQSTTLQLPKKYDTIIFIGRFQPMHNAHVDIIQKAAKMCSQLIIIVGSAGKPCTFKNPWPAEDRINMITGAVNGIADANKCSIRFEENIDTVYNDQAWAIRVQSIVAKYSIPSDKIGIIGHDKDQSTFYLHMFPQWELINVELNGHLHATNIRDLYFRDDMNMNFLRGVVPLFVYNCLDGSKDAPYRRDIIAARKQIAQIKEPYLSLKYPPIFTTVDAVVIQSGHVLMVKRRSNPGKGLMALPGGYVNAHTDVSVKSAMIRELKEETKIKVPAPVLVGSIVGEKVFDAVDRSELGRIITHCFVIRLPDGELPKVKGNDDAIEAKWIPINEVKSENCFDDHFDMLTWAIGC